MAMIFHVCLPFLLLLATLSNTGARKCNGVFCVSEPTTQDTEARGRLHLYTSGGQEMAVLEGAHDNVKYKGVARVRAVGEGCFIIYRRQRFRSDSFLVTPGLMKDLKENGHMWTSVKYVDVTK